MLPVLIGYRGCGKTSVGRAVADALGARHVDTDALVEIAAGRSIAAVFAEQGEAAFRALEAQAVLAALEENAVLSLGGGAVLPDATRDALHASGRSIVYLQCSAATLARRIAGDTANVRPALTSAADSVAEVAAVLAAREPIYRDAATVTVDAEGSLDAVVAAVLRCR